MGVPEDWHGHLLTGFAAHWNKNSNLGQAFDVWFLNLFPRTSHFAYNSGGYLTLSFIPTLGTMVLGVIGGRWFVESAPKIPLRKLIVAGGGADRFGAAVSLHRDLPHRQANLDALVDAVFAAVSASCSSPHSHGSLTCAAGAESCSRWLSLA